MQRVGRHAEHRERAVHVREARRAGQAQEELPVLRGGPGLVEAPRAPEGLAAQRERARLDERLLEQREVDRAGRQRPPVRVRGVEEAAQEHRRGAHEGAQIEGAVEFLEVAEHDVDLRVTGQDRELAGELVRLPEVVGVQEGDHRPGGDRHARVARRRHAAVRAAQPAHAAVGEPGAEARGGVVGRAVVDHDDLEVAVGLRERARDRLPDDAGAVEGRDHDGHPHASPTGARRVPRARRPGRAPAIARPGPPAAAASPCNGVPEPGVGLQAVGARRPPARGYASRRANAPRSGAGRRASQPRARPSAARSSARSRR